MNIMFNSKGQINIIIGCMFSGKSTEMIRIINRYKNIKDAELLIINHTIDNRYGNNVVSSHNKIQIACKSISNLSIIKDSEDYKKANVIFIEEAQFFKDLYEFCLYAADTDKKIIYVVGLDGDFRRNCFGDICRLIPHAENVTKLKALCAKCANGTEATFTKRIVSGEDIELVGTLESYIPVCREHYLEKTNN